MVAVVKVMYVWFDALTNYASAVGGGDKANLGCSYSLRFCNMIPSKMLRVQGSRQNNRILALAGP